MIQDIVVLLLASIAAERLSEIIAESEISKSLLFKEKLQNYLYNPDKPPQKETTAIILLKLLNKLINCGYCVSVHVGAIAALALLLGTDLKIFSVFHNDFILFMTLSLLIHGMSNYLHSAFELVRRGRVTTHDYKIDLKADVRSTGKSDTENQGTPW